MNEVDDTENKHRDQIDRKTQSFGHLPYLEFMITAAGETGLATGKRLPKKTLENWIKNNWPASLGAPTDRKVVYMATFLRRPDDEKGGYFRTEGGPAIEGPD